MKNQICDRCHNKVDLVSMSWFNTEMICLSCKEKESKDPRFEEAKEKELEEVKKGNFNFEGIGL